MPRKREVVKINDVEYTVKELTVEQIIDITSGSVFFSSLLKGPDEKDGEVKNETIKDQLYSAKADIERVLKLACDFSIEDLQKLAPSEIRIIYDKFMEVNSDFFLIIDKVGILEIVVGIKEVLLRHYSRALAVLSNPGM